MKLSSRFASLALLASITALAQSQPRWLPFGPDGGDARSFAADPADHKHLFLGTVSGTIYDTYDGGRTWQWLAEPGQRDDLAFDNLIVDPADTDRILAAGWAIDQQDGGLYISSDRGKTWTSNPQLKGHSIRSMAIAPSNPRMLVAGALDGVYRSQDGGITWSLISPLGSTEIHEVESVAIDPKNPAILYAGTWHLPWKTTDGGVTWTNMKEGIFDDSDVFSIIIDPDKPKEIFLSACSGIYRSSDQGETFLKVQGIPSSARRTRVLMQDSKQPSTVFAGTTEGLWRTADSGRTFLRYGDPGWVINDVAIDPTNSNHVLLATDRTGVLLSEDGGFTFTPANRGFASRQISAIAQDRANPRHVWVGVLNDKAAGGVYTSLNGGVTWQQSSSGLDGADIFSLTQAPDGTLLAGTRHGIVTMTNGTWQPPALALSPDDPLAVREAPKSPAAPKRHPVQKTSVSKTNTAMRASHAKKPVPSIRQATSVGTAPERDQSPSNTGIDALLTTDGAVFAATDDGLLTSADSGRLWTHIRGMQGKPWRMLAANSLRVLAADQRSLVLSVDHGHNFKPIAGPPELTYLTAITIDSGGRLWVGGPQGVFYSNDDGNHWQSQKGLFVPDVSSLAFDRGGNRVLVTANRPNTVVFAVHVPDMTVSYSESGWPLRFVLPVSDYLLGVTPFDGVVLQPRMVVSDTAPYR